MLSPPPPPPGPESIAADQPQTSQQQQHQPTFIEQWLVDEERRKKHQRAAASTSKLSAHKYIERQYLLPLHIPPSAMCNIDPMIHLISDFIADTSNTNNANGETTAATPAAATNKSRIAKSATAWDDIRQIASRCATYKSRAEQNHIEFQYKRAVKVHDRQEQEQRRQHQQQYLEQSASSSTTIFDNNNLDPSTLTTNSSSATTIPITSTTDGETITSTTATTTHPMKQRQLHPPPFHPEYTPLTLSENFILSKIYSANYNVCLAHTSCPQLSSRLLSCWKRSDPAWVQHMKEHEMERYVCMEERMAVERCVGRRVQNAMKDILG